MNARNGAVFDEFRPFRPRSQSNNVSAGVFDEQRVVVTQCFNDWAEPVRTQLLELNDLEKDWDGYGGRSVFYHTARFAADLLERLCVPKLSPPSLTPLGSGGILAEWHRDDKVIEIEIESPHEVYAYRKGPDLEEEIKIDVDYSEVAAWLRELSHA
jgi:hypothetical protein